MDTTRLASFSDVVLAILLTIMVLELKIPATAFLYRRVSVTVLWANQHLLLPHR